MTSRFETTNMEGFSPATTFDEMGLTDELLRGVYSMGYTHPSPIQSVTIMPQKAGRDVLGQSSSGQGKTAAFSIGLLSRVDPTVKQVQALVLSHTHELAEQTASVIRGLGTYMGIQVVLAVGGTPRRQNASDLRGGAQVVVGTPGRIFDLASSGDLRFGGVRSFVIDEADEMLRDRFADQVSEIIKIANFPKTTAVAFFSATMPPEVRELADKILENPVRVTLKTADVKLDGIKQFYVALEDESFKIDVFSDIFESLTIESSIVFCNTKERAERLYKLLTERGFPVSVIYGEPMTQPERKQRMAAFRSGETRVLIATNLLARGIDVQQVSVVFNFDMPSFDDKENYIHRIGRCGRFGRKGTAISLLTPAEKDVMDQIAQHYSFAPLPLPENLKGVVD